MANYETIGTMEYPNIVNGAGIPVVTGMRTILSGQGALKAGTALAKNSAGKMVILGTASATANCVLAEDVDATSADTTALVYLSGHFNRNNLVVNAGYTITETDVEAFRAAGIYVENSMK